MSQLMVSVSGMRGVVGEGLTPELVTAYAAAFGTYCHGGKIIVGRDSRTTGEMVRHAALAGLLAVGCDVMDLNIVPTPTIQLAVRNHGASGGIAFTASHNPAEWNALKFFSAEGLFLDEAQGAELLAIKDNWAVQYVRFDRIGHVTKAQQAIEEHISAVLNYPLFDIPAIRKRCFRVAVDAVGGAGSLLIPQLLAELGCEVVKLNCEVTGFFPHNPEPLPENLTDLCKLVKQERCDLGVAVDPDADRLALIDETGHPIGEENTLVLAASLVLRHQPGPVATNVSTTRALDDITGRAGVPLYRSKVGEIHVVKKMQEVKAVIGGEGNGGVIFPAINYARDSAVGTTMTLQSLVEAGTSLSNLMKVFPSYVISKRKVPRGDLQPDQLISALSEHFRVDQQDRTDGLKVIRPEGWFQMRPSNTEPILRIYAEGKDSAGAEALAQEAASALEAIVTKLQGAP
ncbi:MAG: phosphoglucosamine mutase [bacterium]|nr:phosphoglucosamine mutase [bacterium]